MTPEQCRMARGALNWTGRDLARAARLSHNTILAFELGRSVRYSSVHAIKSVFEHHGVRFSERAGEVSVRLGKEMEQA